MAPALIALALLASAHTGPQQADRPRVPLCSAQEGELDRKLAERREDGRVWWYPDAGPNAVPYDWKKEVTALQRPWFRERSTLTVDGSRWRFSRIDQVDNTAFRRYNRPHEAVDGVPTITPMGLDDELWILLEPIGCRFAVWTRAG